VFQVLEYIKFLFRSTNHHGVHSPFVYALVTKCFYDKTAYKEYAKLSAYRKQLLKNDNTIDITDFGSGSRVFKGSKRHINAVAKTSGTPLKRAKLLFRMARYFKPAHTLELGTSLGIATHALALGHTENSVVTIEGCASIAEVAQTQLEAFQVKTIIFNIGQFNDELPKLKNATYDLVFFDGNHTKKATLTYFESLLTKAHNDSVFIFDDIHWSKDMADAWETIKRHPSVTVTIDTFFWGFVFFRKEQEKEHFNIRV